MSNETIRTAMPGRRRAGLRGLGALALLLAVLLAPALPVAAQDSEIVASLQRVQGTVHVEQKATGETLVGRNGLLLRHGDTVVTEDKSRASVKFRDGSEIRLFPGTRFTVQADELEGQERFFSMKLLMKLGSFWGNFVKQRQIAQIDTPTATIGIKGTTLRVTDSGQSARVALTEGLIDVSNDRTQVELQPGKRLTEFARTDDLATKVADIPYQLDLTTEQRELSFPNGRPEEVNLTIQLVDIKSGNAVARSGLLYLRSNYERIAYPATAALDERGFARVRIELQPPEPADADLNGNVYVWAVIDQADADDTKEGRVLLKIPVPAGEAKVKVDARTGEGKRVQ